jgi:hypothetical protein
LTDSENQPRYLAAMMRVVTEAAPMN